MTGLASPITLRARDNRESGAARYGCRSAASGQDLGDRVQLKNGLSRDPGTASEPFLRIPTFPGRKVDGFARTPSGDNLRAEAEDHVALIRELRVGGTYWAAQPPLPHDYVLLRSEDALEIDTVQDAGGPIVLWSPRPAAGAGKAVVVSGDCDPWHMLAGAKALFCEVEDELSTIAALLGVPTYVRSHQSCSFELRSEDAASLLVRELGDMRAANPFTGEEMSLRQTIELCGFWRALVDSNRDIAGALGFAFWKRDNVAPLLWGGSGPVRFEGIGPASDSRPYAIWRSKVAEDSIASLESMGTPLIEVEDGFLRSQGLGADCVPPLSITVDRLGAYFDPSRPSELEGLLQDGAFDEDLLARARILRSVIVAAGLGKYEAGLEGLGRPAGSRRHILVPGQVEDDRSVLTGGCGLVSNLDLLKRVREVAPEAYVLFKPHPDVLAGHRKGSISERACLELADEVVSDFPISSLIEMVDEVHVNTSLAGFEALMRDKPVTTHGVPFYAGWGLTRDLGPVPSRRTAKRTLDELVAATLLLYPRYLDPVTGLPCPAEVVVRRLVEGMAAQDGMVVSMRRIQGKVLRRLRELAR